MSKIFKISAQALTLAIIMFVTASCTDEKRERLEELLPDQYEDFRSLNMIGIYFSEAQFDGDKLVVDYFVDEPMLNLFDNDEETVKDAFAELYSGYAEYSEEFYRLLAEAGMGLELKLHNGDYDMDVEWTPAEYKELTEEWFQ